MPKEHAHESFRNQSSYELAKYQRLDNEADLEQNQDWLGENCSLDPVHHDLGNATRQKGSGQTLSF